MTLDALKAGFERLDHKTRVRLGIVLGAFLVVVIAVFSINARTSDLEKKRHARDCQEQSSRVQESPNRQT